MDQEKLDKLLFASKKSYWNTVNLKLEVERMFGKKPSKIYMTAISSEDEICREQSPSVILAAYEMLGYCQRVLKLPNLKIAWLKVMRPGDVVYDVWKKPFWGSSKADEEVILLNAEAPFTKTEVKHTVAHEARHVWHQKKYGIPGDEDKMEMFAEIACLELVQEDWKKKDLEKIAELHAASLRK
jgi:hypothetical protein